MEYARVDRFKIEAQAWYDQPAGWYDRLIYPFERAAIEHCLAVAALRPGESVLEIGAGTGQTYLRLSEVVGKAGRVIGIDISQNMLKRTYQKLAVAEYPQTAMLQADGTSLPVSADRVDVVVMTFTLELFPIDQLEQVLAETQCVLDESGRLVVLSLYRQGRMAKLYETLHKAFPKQFDCRPLPLAELLSDRGWASQTSATGTLGGFPFIIVEAAPPRS